MPEISINTTQNVNINFSVANIGTRMGAFLIDGIMKLCYHFFIQWAIISNSDIENIVLDNWSERAIYVILYAPVMFYSLMQESLMEGQTIGKKFLGIKVVKIDGYQASFFDFLIRWIMRLIDISGTLCMAGTVSMVVSKVHQRLGDIAAGTAVISLKNNINISHTILENISEDYKAKYPMVVRFSDNDMRIIKETYQTAMINNDFSTLSKLAEKIKKVSGIKQEGSDSKFIADIISDFNFYTGK